MNWKEELRRLVDNGCTDSAIRDFIDEHPDVNGHEIWDYVSELNAPNSCKGCKYIQMSGMFPCNKCSRRVTLKDYFESSSKASSK